MSVLVAFTIGLVFWIAGWAFGIKSFDAFLVTIALTLIAVMLRLVTPWLNEQIRP